MGSKEHKLSKVVDIILSIKGEFPKTPIGKCIYDAIGDVPLYKMTDDALYAALSDYFMLKMTGNDTTKKGIDDVVKGGMNLTKLFEDE